MRLMIELDFYIYVFSMELRSFEKPYVALLNSSNWATGGPHRDIEVLCCVLEPTMELNKHFARSALKDIEVLCCELEPTMELNKHFARSALKDIEVLCCVR